MLFSEVIGQSEIKALLVQMTQSGRLPHATLFLGPQGCGKLALALALAQYLLCENPTGVDACGSCRHCIKSSKLIHPDLHFSYPTIGTNVKSETFLPQWRSAMESNPYLDINQWLRSIDAENKQGNINKEECVNIIRKLSLKTFEAKRKILIMWLPEYLGKEGNRLLKIIEEPPPLTNFILVAENPELILNTILSRCQLIKVNPLSDEAIVAGIQEKTNVERENAQAIAHLANGNFNEAIQLATHGSNDNAKLFLDWMRRCYKGNGPEMVEWVEKFAGIGRENQKHFLRYALHFLREYMILKMTGNQQVRLRNEELTTAINLAKVIEMDQIELIVNLLNDGSYFVERNANPKILFLDISINIHKILKRKSITLVHSKV